MGPIDNLAADHLSIVGGIRALDRLVILPGLGPATLAAWSAVHDFLARWADGAHYAKEELLFQKVVQSGLPCIGGPAACLRMEHEATLAQLGRMRAALAELRGGGEGHELTLRDAGARYGAIISVHLPNEDAGFFPMARQLLSPEAQKELEDAFAAIDGALPQPIDAAVETVQRAVDAAAGSPRAKPPAPGPHGPVNFDFPDPLLEEALRQLARHAAAMPVRPPWRRH